MKKSVMFALLLIVVVAILWTVWPRPEPEYPIRQVSFTQPLDHALPDGPSFEQYVDILQPAGASAGSPVLFVLGGEGNLTDRRLSSLYEAYGSPPDVVFIQAEHRGYGESLSLDADQSVPAYVTVDQALADFHAVIQDLKKEYTGPWAAAGYSYSGGLVVDLAAR
ncbi:MAG: S28 family serine protease, partial [Anaerolineae bacterium]|nr:S28 family serine protease [Anaerolineae bacterium]